MQVRFTVTPLILFGAQRAIARHVKWMHLGGYFVAFLFPVLMIGLNLLYGGGVGGAIRNDAGMIFGLPLFWLVGIPLLQRLGARRTLANSPALQGEHVYTIEESGLQLHTGVTDVRLSWAGIVRAVETKAFVLLFQNKMMATFIPKAAFREPSEIEEFRALVSSAIGPRAQWSDSTGSALLAT
jgi:hypothetical protein